MDDRVYTAYRHVAAQSFAEDERAKFAERFGVKAAGLARLEPAATPPFFVLDTTLYRAWKATGDLSTAIRETLGSADTLTELVLDLGGEVVVRSSATNEDLRSRGQHLSVQTTHETVLSATRAIFEQFASGLYSGEMALIIQSHVTLSLNGFLSNEYRVADKPYRWRVEISSANPSAVGQSYMLSAKQAASVEMAEPLRASNGHGLRRQLSGVARWLWRSSARYGVDRSALEWGWDGERLWLFQWDDVQDASDAGIDPTKITLPSVRAIPDRDGRIFHRFVVGSTTPWPKLRKLSTFAFPGYMPPHMLFSVPALKIAAAVSSRAQREFLAREIDQLTDGQAVVRTDTVRGGFDLPKTDLVSGVSAVEFIQESLSQFADRGLRLEDVGFILHRFIPSHACAWSYHRPGSNFIFIDALWGLADGLQYLDCDTFVYDRTLDREVSAQVRYKAKFLNVCRDGSWRYQDIKASSSRSRSLTKAAVLEIGRKTSEIGNQLEEATPIMWFCGIPVELGLGAQLPWYRADPQAGFEERKSPKLVPVFVRSVDDLRRLTDLDTRTRKLVLEPGVEDIRNPEFLKLVQERCLALKVPVEMRGSVLSHAYHQLRAAGVEVFSADPTRRPMEIRQQRAFGKLVRDAVPTRIRFGGESAKAFRLVGPEKRRLLAGKLIEEAEEFLLAQSPDAQIEELADLLEVIVGLGEEIGVALPELIEAAVVKREKRGGFSAGLVLTSTSTRALENPPATLFPEPPAGEADQRVSAQRFDGIEELSLSSALVSAGSLLAQSQALSITLDKADVRVRVTLRLRAGRIKITLEDVDSPRDQTLL